MRFTLLVLFFLLAGYSFAVNTVVDKFQETSIRLKHREAKDITPYLLPHLFKDGRITGDGNTISIFSTESNIKELLVIIGDLDRSDHLQLIISITMNINAVHNVNTRSIQVGSKTWTKINYGITYSDRTREKLDNGKLIEKINYIKVVESFQIHTELKNANKSLTLKLRATQDSPEYDETKNIEIESIQLDQSSQFINEDNQIVISGKVNKWINLANAISSIYSNNSEDTNISIERQQLTKNMAIKVQILQ